MKKKWQNLASIPIQPHFSAIFPLFLPKYAFFMHAHAQKSAKNLPKCLPKLQKTHIFPPKKPKNPFLQLCIYILFASILFASAQSPSSSPSHSFPLSRCTLHQTRSLRLGMPFAIVLSLGANACVLPPNVRATSSKFPSNYPKSPQFPRARLASRAKLCYNVFCIGIQCSCS